MMMAREICWKSMKVVASGKEKKVKRMGVTATVSVVSLVKWFHSLNICVLNLDRKKQTKT